MHFENIQHFKVFACRLPDVFECLGPVPKAINIHRQVWPTGMQKQASHLRKTGNKWQKKGQFLTILDQVNLCSKIDGLFDNFVTFQ